MKKVIASLALGTIGLAGCTSTDTVSTSDTTRPPITITQPTQPTTNTQPDVDLEHISNCITRLERWNVNNTVLMQRFQITDPSSTSELRVIVNDTQDHIDNGRIIVTDCRQYAPAATADFDAALDEMQSTLDRLRVLL